MCEREREGTQLLGSWDIVSQGPNSECPLSHNMSYTLLSIGSLEAELGGYPLVDCMRLMQQLLRLQVKTSTVY